MNENNVEVRIAEDKYGKYLYLVDGSRKTQVTVSDEILAELKLIMDSYVVGQQNIRRNIK